DSITGRHGVCSLLLDDNAGRGECLPNGHDDQSVRLHLNIITYLCKTTRLPHGIFDPTLEHRDTSNDQRAQRVRYRDDYLDDRRRRAHGRCMRNGNLKIVDHIIDMVSGPGTRVILAPSAPNWSIGIQMPKIQGISATVATGGTLASSTSF